MLFALRKAKIVRAKNNCHDLSIMAKKVGSNFFLSDKRLSFVPNLGFDSVKSYRASLRAGAPDPAISESVSPDGFEPNYRNCERLAKNIYS